MSCAWDFNHHSKPESYNVHSNSADVGKLAVSGHSDWSATTLTNLLSRLHTLSILFSTHSTLYKFDIHPLLYRIQIVIIEILNVTKHCHLNLKCLCRKSNLCQHFAIMEKDGITI